MILRTKKDYISPTAYRVVSMQLETALLVTSKDVFSGGEGIIWDNEASGENLFWDTEISGEGKYWDWQQEK